MSKRPTKMIEIQLLGSFRVMDGLSGRGIDLKSRKARALLAYLAMQGDFSAGREKVSNLLWVDHEDSNARHSLRQCLVTLRKELNGVCAEAIDVGRETIRLNPDLVDVDARRLLSFKNVADHHALMPLLQSLQTDFLADLSINDAFDAWVLEQRKNIAGKVGDILKELVQEENIAAIGAQATDAAEQLITIDPLREDWRRVLLSLSARVHGRARALAHYKEYVAFLRDEEPSKATVALVGRIERGELVSGDAATDASIKALAAKSQSETQRPIVPGKRAIRVHSPSAPAGPTQSNGISLRRGHRLALGLICVVLISVIAVTLSKSSTTAVAGIRQVVSRAQGDPLQGLAAVAVLPPQPSDGSLEPLHRSVVHKLSKLRIAKIVGYAAADARRHYRLAISSPSPEVASVSLMDPDGVRLWQQEFNLGEVLSTQEDIARQVGYETEIQLIRSEARAAARSDVDVSALLLNARAEQNRGQTGKEEAQSRKLYERALQLDSESATAMAGLAGQLVARQLSTLDHDSESDRRAERLLRRAITIDPGLPVAHFFMGLLHKSRGHGNQAILSFNRTLELNPSFAPAYANLGHALMLVGRLEEGLINVRHAMRISPNNAYYATWAMFAGEIEFERDNVPAALAWFELALTRAPSLTRGYGWLAAAYEQVGDYAAADRYMQEFKALLGNLSSRRLDEKLRHFPEGGLQQSRPKLYQALLKTADHIR